jgi:intracellular sulfur oxidation DsrE/DsrF family protein
MMRAAGLIALLCGLLAAAAPAAAQTRSGPLIEGFGIPHTPPGAQERPDPALRYRVLFNVTVAATAPGSVNPALNRVARLLNLLAEDGIRPAPGDIVAIVHGDATTAIMTDPSYAARTGAAANPNLPLIARLRAAGVTVAVCSQALHTHNVALADVSPLMRVDVSALVTLSNLQLRGYALIPD